MNTPRTVLLSLALGAGVVLAGAGVAAAQTEDTTPDPTTPTEEAPEAGTADGREGCDRDEAAAEGTTGATTAA